MQKLSFEMVEFNPKNLPITHAVIWLHGLGASGHDFVPVVPMLGLNPEVAIRFIFPHAPRIPVTVNGGYVMPAWYDILEMNLDRKVDIAQIIASSDAINALIDDEIAKGVASENIIIAGFSQGGAVAYHTVLHNQRKLAGLLALSTYFATANTLSEVPVNTQIPVKIDHGSFDDIVPPILAQQAEQSLQNLGLQPVLTHYPAAHQVVAAQISDIGKWINQVFAA